jgi:thiol:disulfide interchange protein DsbC
MNIIKTGTATSATKSITKNTVKSTAIAMNTSLKGAVVLGLFGLLLAASAQLFAQESAIKKTIEERLGDGVKIDSVLRGPMPGIYEVRVGTDVFYTDDKAQYLILGQIQDLKSGKNYTQERLDGLATDAVFSTSNKANALKLVKGNGKREVAVFEDANCGYCKKLRVELEKLTDVTIYTYLVPILSQDSETKMRGVWCAKDRNKAYDDWMLRGANPPAADDRCNVPVEANSNLARTLRVNGTPALFFSNGKRVPGYIDAAQIEQGLSTANAVAAAK